MRFDVAYKKFAGGAVLAGCLLAGQPRLATAADEIDVPPAPASDIPDLLDEDTQAAQPIEPSDYEADVDGTGDVVRERYPSMALRVERSVKLDDERNYVNHGPWTMFDEKGGVIGRGQFKMGRHHGNWTRWYKPEEGKMFADPLFAEFQRPFRAEFQLRDGRLHGAWTVYDARDRMACQWEFKDGQRHGRSTWWFPDGQMRREATFDNGQLDDELIELNAKQQVVSKTVYVAGHELAKEMTWYGPGKKKAEGWLLKPRKVDRAKYMWWDGEVVLNTNPAAAPAQRHGEWMFWHPNGERLSRGKYDLGRLTGSWVWWYPTGQALARGEFNDGVADARWIWWHGNGHRQCIGSFALGKQVGLWSSWKDDGKLTVVHDFSAPAAEQVRSEEPEPEPMETIAVKPVEDVPLPDLQALKKQLQR
jgi:antitoxin component YwqK of YwqJK toxin-antitoxin module